jgi:superfamily II DNA/RNA helicase
VHVKTDRSAERIFSISNFADLGLGPDVLKAVVESGYTTPTPIQEKAIPYVLMGRDVLGCAQTGTGKTASFTLPMIEILAATRVRARMPRSLILAPTRELAAQVAESFERYAKHHNFDFALLIGGTSLEDQERKLDRGVQVLIATPGRLLDLFERGKVLLADVKILVIDEADRMLDMGFIPDVERIVKLLPRIRQTLFFSATLAPVIRKIADAFLINPKEISVDPPASPAETVSQSLLRVRGTVKEKRAALRTLIRREELNSALVFCNRKKDVDILNRSLSKHDFCNAALHGDMVQSLRMETLQRFKDGEVKILVCSDVAARGLDIPAVSHVFNFDVPNTPEDYVHRIGRTGRAGRSGRAFMLALPEEAKPLDAIVSMAGPRMEVMDLEGTETWNRGDPDLETDPTSRRRGRGRGRKGDSNKETTASQRNGRRAAPSGPRSRRDSEPGSAPSEKICDNGVDDTLDVPATSFGDHTPAFMRRALS